MQRPDDVMKARALIFSAFMLTVGMVAWFSSPIKFPGLEPVLNPDGNSGGQNTELTDRDSAAEEVRAVAAKISNLEQLIADGQEFAQLERDRIRDDFRALINQMGSSEAGAHDAELLRGIEESIYELNLRTDTLDQKINDQQSYAPSSALSPTTQFTWLESVDAQAYPYQSDQFQAFDDGLNSAAAIESDVLGSGSLAEGLSAHYTIPPTTTLLNGTALTALVGRIPVQGRLEDPWRFKIITGAENLAANGHRIPQISGMLWSGTARGDFALSCVSGNIDTAAYIFSDGTIRTVRTDASVDNLNSGLGWISDERGNPCINGELKTNAAQFLAQATLVNTAAAAGSAFANAQTTTTSSATGETTESLTGNIDDFIVGRATEEALSDISQWLSDRRQNSFDAVYVKAGQAVAIHVETPILIDYELNGRKVNHFGHASTNQHLGWHD